jgi:PAS domain S-box-containing protein
MERKPSYEELAASVVRLERELALRKQEGESLHGSSSMLRLIFDAVDVGIILVDAAGTITFANRRMAEMFGRGVEEVIGIPYTKLTHETHSGQAEAKLRELIDGTIETVDQEGRYQRKDGSEFWGQLSGSRLLGDDGRFLTLLGAIQDITRRRIADEKLRESGEIMRYIVKHDPNAIAVFDRNLNYIAVSDRNLRDYDVQESDILGKHHYEVFPEIPGKW